MAEESSPLVGSGSRGYVGQRGRKEPMLWGRHLATIFSKYKWYYPQPEIESLNLDKAWEFYERTTIPRFEKNSDSQDRFPRAVPGETKIETAFYPLFGTPESEMTDLGLGVGIYFFTLRWLGIILFLAGCISIPNMVYFNSSKYGGGSRLSAICTEHTWMPCPTCSEVAEDTSKYATVAYSEDDADLMFIQTNDCQVDRSVGVWAFLTLIFVSITLYLFAGVASKREKELDYSENTTQDYSIEVLNPLPKARDPNEWKEFFSQFGKVKSVSVVQNNTKLLLALRKRRTLILQLTRLQKDFGADLFDGNNWRDYVENTITPGRYSMQSNARSISDKIEACEVRIKDLSKENFDVVEVFVIFDKIASQKEAVKALACRGLDILISTTTNMPTEHLFRGTELLDVIEAPEPEAVRWQDLDDSWMWQYFLIFFTTCCTVVAIIISTYLIRWVKSSCGVTWAAYTITLLTSAAPYLSKFLAYFESHITIGLKEAWSYFKTTIFLWYVVAVCIYLILPFSSYIGDEDTDLIPSIYAIFIAAMWMTPLIQYIDIMGQIKRHYLAPRARTQQEMNSYFTGSKNLLSYRYCNMTKIMFLCFFYAMIFPVGYFLGAAILFLTYWFDKFSMLRSWAPMPKIGAEVAKMSRTFAFSSAVAVYVIIISYNYAAFPMDNACDTGESITDAYIGNFTIIDEDDDTVSVSFDDGGDLYEYCNQNELSNRIFPPRGGDWMAESSENFLWVFQWMCVIVPLFVGLYLLKYSVQMFQGFFFKPHLIPVADVDKDENSDFETIGNRSLKLLKYGVHIYQRAMACDEIENEISFEKIGNPVAFVPNIDIPGYPLPVLACDISGLPHKSMVGFKEPEEGFFEGMNFLINDLDCLKDADAFGVVTYYE